MTIADNLMAPGDNDASTSAAADRLVLVPIGSEDWLIHDTSFPDNDARHLVACVRERGLDHVDVIWLRGRGLPARFARVSDALDAAARAVGDRRPAPRPHPENWLG